MKNFFTSMFTEGGKISHKRWISVTVAAVLCWSIVYTVIKDADKREIMVKSTMVFILVMSGVATVPQIVGLIRGNAPVETKDEPKTETKMDGDA